MFLKRIRIENVRAIGESTLDFQSEEGGTRQWTLLLGENGAGKSTLLRCAALLLCGRDALAELLGPDPSRWIRTGQPSARIEGTVATAAGDERAVHLELIHEIDLHLHVKWQRRLRRFLECKLPQFQIVATTHSPMTAQQAGPGDVHILARPSAEAPPQLQPYEGAPDRLGLHQLIEPFFDVDTVDSESLATCKDEYRRLTAKKRRSADEERRLQDLREQLADAPAWDGGERAREQTAALRSIQALIERAGVD